MRRTGKALGTLAAATSLTMLGGGLALADDVYNTLDLTVDATLESTSITVGGTRTVSFKIDQTNGDGKNGCNLQNNEDFLKLNVVSSSADVSVSPSTIQFDQCGDVEDVVLTGTGVGGATVSLTEHSRRLATSSTFNLLPAAFTVSVAAAPVVDTTPTDPCLAVATPGAPVFSNGGSEWSQSPITPSATSTGGSVTYAATAAGPFGSASELSDGEHTVYAIGTSSTCDKTSSASSQSYNIDTADPVVSGADVADTTWRSTALSADYTADDITSGLADASDAAFTLTAAAESTKDAAGNVTPTSVAKSVEDNAGRRTTRTLSALIDSTAPSASLVGGPAATSYWTTQVPAAPTCGGSDALSGVASCVVAGYSAAAGSHTVTATATDRAGNTGSASVTYTVRRLTSTGFYSPVDMGGALNTVKGGSTVPLKFNLLVDGEQQTSTALVASFTAARVGCVTTTEDAVELVTTGATALRYDGTAAAGQFIQNWKTPAGAGHCYQATATLADGQKITALFKLK